MVGCVRGTELTILTAEFGGGEVLNAREACAEGVEKGRVCGEVGERMLFCYGWVAGEKEEVDAVCLVREEGGRLDGRE